MRANLIVLVESEIILTIYLIIRLQTRDFYQVIVDEGESNCFSRIRDHNCVKTLKNASWKPFKKKMLQENDCFATRFLSRNR